LRKCEAHRSSEREIGERNPVAHHVGFALQVFVDGADGARLPCGEEIMALESATVRRKSY
jgi:hypothetical protein